MFSVRKNVILNTLGIICTAQNFWHGKALNIYIDVLPKQATCEMKAL